MSTREKKSYEPEFIERAVKLALEAEKPGEVAKNLGVNRRTLYGWMQKYHQGSVQSRPVNDEHVFEELKRLRKENTRLKEERDILKNWFTRRAGACLDRNTL